MDKGNKKSKMTEQIEKRQSNGAIIQPGESSLPFAMAAGNGAGISPEQLAKINNAKKLDFDVKGEYWSPTNPGERKRLVFQYLVKGEMTKNKFGNDPDEMVPVDTAYFVEVYEEEKAVKQQMIRSCATVLISFLEKRNVPKHAILDVEYKGKKKGEKFSFDDFKIIPVIYDFDQTEVVEEEVQEAMEV